MAPATADVTAQSAAIAAAAAVLTEASLRRAPCAPVRTLLVEGDISAAYAVQTQLTRQRVAGGARIVGRKIGLTNPVVQRQLGVDQPDFGVLFADMDCTGSAVISMERLLQPRIEAEIAFVLGTDLDADDISSADVAAATDHVVVALEIVDSRITAWDISIVDTVADNGSAGLFVCGADTHGLPDVDLVSATMDMTRNGESVSSGRGADCLGDPLIAVAWLANAVRRYGDPLHAGDVVLSGALGPMVTVAPGDVFTSTVSGLGSVTARFGPAA